MWRHLLGIALLFSTNVCKLVLVRIALERQVRIKHSAVRCRYNAVDFLQNLYKRHTIAPLQGRDMGCLLWVKTLMDILSQSLKWCMQYHVIFDWVITALDCISWQVVVFLIVSWLHKCAILGFNRCLNALAAGEYHRTLGARVVSMEIHSLNLPKEKGGLGRELFIHPFISGVPNKSKDVWSIKNEW